MAQETLTLRPKLLETIRDDFNLNIYEARIWLALLGSGVATAGKLADISKVPRSRCYDILETLEKKGFILMKIGRPIKYIAVPPEEVMSRVKKNIVGNTDSKLSVLNELKNSDIFSELELLHSAGIKPVEVSDLSSTVIGDKNINYFVRQMIDRATKEIKIACTSDCAYRMLTSLRSRLVHAGKRGIAIKILSPINDMYGKKIKGAEVSHVDHNSNFVMIDNKEIVLYASPNIEDSEYELAIWISAEFTVNAYWSLFEPFTSNAIKQNL